jgi:hypothetical protein
MPTRVLRIVFWISLAALAFLLKSPSTTHPALFYIAYILALMLGSYLWNFPFNAWVTKSPLLGLRLSTSAFQLSIPVFAMFTWLRVAGWTESQLVLSFVLMGVWTLLLCFAMAWSLNRAGVLPSDVYWVWILFTPLLIVVSIMTALFPLPLVLSLLKSG